MGTAAVVRDTDRQTKSELFDPRAARKYDQHDFTIQQAWCLWYHQPIRIAEAAELSAVPVGFMRTFVKIAYDQNGRACDAEVPREIREYENPYS